MLRLKEILREKNVTTKALAKEFGATPQYISNIIRERDTPSLKTLTRIAAILKVPLSALFEDNADDTFICPHCGAPIHIEIR